jgi:hypothetical protein
MENKAVVENTPKEEISKKHVKKEIERTPKPGRIIVRNLQFDINKKHIE